MKRDGILDSNRHSLHSLMPQTAALRGQFPISILQIIVYTTDEKITIISFAESVWQSPSYSFATGFEIKELKWDGLAQEIEKRIVEGSI